MMNAQSKIEAAAEQPFVEAFNALPDRDALRLLATLAKRFSGCGYAYDRLDAGIEQCATELAEQEGFTGDDLANRYLESPTRFGPSFELAPVVRLSGTSVVA